MREIEDKLVYSDKDMELIEYYVNAIKQREKEIFNQFDPDSAISLKMTDVQHLKMFHNIYKMLLANKFGYASKKWNFDKKEEEV